MNRFVVLSFLSIGSVCGLPMGSDGGSMPQFRFRFPWHASVFVKQYGPNWMSDKWTYHCGGSLITKRVVITTSFSVEYRKTETIQVAFAKFDQDWEKDGPYTLKRNVTAVAFPKAAEDGSYATDLGNAWNIALVLLSNSVDFNDYVMPVVRPTPSIDSSHFTTARVTSWNGRNKTLGQNEVAIYECVKKGHPKTNQICGQSYDNSTPPAVSGGDSGSGLTVEVDGKHYLIGFVSLKFPDVVVFTNVSYPDHRRWLDEKLAKFEDGGSW